jgi:protein PsiE
MNRSRVAVARQLLDALQMAGLGVIALATVVAIGQEIWKMVDARAVTLADLLLLFIFLEVLAMVGMYLESGQLPVRLPLYIAIVALARYLALDMKAMSPWEVVAVAAAALVLAATVLVIRYGHLRYPYGREEDRS